ncbi:DNA-binding protein [Hyphomonas sp. UBA1923]|uniref:DNA-binding protein n=1 Tax=Hyphomonas sp. UBA1923 TaxID=1946617 RepID=UPI0025C2F0E0|nr:DNA-binding protein [Hyphomonas sp. UBA1923]|tara:strand:- start:18653 stop:18877 length:225 start_codon:yes stop_codon:yes gene_type:complete
MNVQNILTVSQLAELNPAFTEPTLRWWIFHADRFDFNKCLIRIGGRVYIDLRAFTEWLDAHRAEAFNDNIEVVE